LAAGEHRTKPRTAPPSTVLSESDLRFATTMSGHRHRRRARSRRPPTCAGSSLRTVCVWST